MPHHCIVPQCSNNSTMPGLSFYRFPLHDQNLLDKWLVNIRRSNIRLNEYSRVCSAHFEGGKKSDKNPITTVFPWVKAECSRPPAKSRADPPSYIGNPVLLASQLIYTQKIMRALAAEISLKLPHKIKKFW